METKLSLLCLLLTVIIQVEGRESYKAPVEDKLYDEVLSNHRISRHIRPVPDSFSTLKVGLGLALLRFESLDEMQDVLTLKTWIRYVWNNAYLRWNPSDFNGTDHIRIPAEIIWNPDVVVQDSTRDSEVSNALADVSSDGTVLYIPPTRIHTHCSLDFEYFPYDKQVCEITFGSLTYDGSKLDIDFYDGFEDIDLSSYVESREWELIDHSAKKNTKYYPCCEEPYPDLTFSLTVRRRTSYYTFVYLGPAVVLSLLAPFIFLLPPGDQQKITLGVGLLVCYTLFFLEMATTLPTIHAQTPLIDKYYMTMYVLVAMAMALSTLVSNLARRTITLRHPPEIIKKVLLSCLGRCLCVSYSMYSDLPPAEEVAPDVKVTGTGEGEIQRQLSAGSDIKEWLLIATVVDRLLFLVYLVLSVVLTIIILSCRG